MPPALMAGVTMKEHLKIGMNFSENRAVALGPCSATPTILKDLFVKAWATQSYTMPRLMDVVGKAPSSESTPRPLPETTPVPVPRSAKPKRGMMALCDKSNSDADFAKMAPTPVPKATEEQNPAASSPMVIEEGAEDDAAGTEASGVGSTNAVCKKKRKRRSTEGPQQAAETKDESNEQINFRLPKRRVRSASAEAGCSRSP